MSRHHRNHSPRQWRDFRDSGLLSERHVQMAIGLEMRADSLIDAHKKAADGKGLLLLEWLEDRYFAKFGTYAPVDDDATAAAQSEHPAQHSLAPDPFEIVEALLADDEDESALENLGEHIREADENAPVSHGEIAEADREQLKRHENFRKAARALSQRLQTLPEVQKVVLFGSVALPLWKEVPRFSRLRNKRIKIYHECANIDIAVWLTTPERAPDIRKLVSSTVNDLNDLGTNLSIAHHVFSVHLVDTATTRYHGMVCHYGQCPKGKRECLVPGCGDSKFVRVLEHFELKPARLNSHNSQVLFERE